MKELIDQKRNSYIRQGINADIICGTHEMPLQTFLGSTDRKGYTVKISCDWLDEHYESYVNIEPFISSEHGDYLITHAEEEAKHKLAEQILNKYFN